MGIIRVKVGILDKSQLPLTTDLVFGTEGYHITYTLEDDSFELVVAPAEDVDHMDQDDFGAGNGGSKDSDRETSAKKLKSDSCHGKEKMRTELCMSIELGPKGYIYMGHPKP